MNELIDKKADSFLSYSFDNFINLSKNNLNEKLLLLKKNYPIYNLNKEMEISKLINSLDDINQIENATFTILDKKLDNIKREIEEKISKSLSDKLD